MSMTTPREAAEALIFSALALAAIQHKPIPDGPVEQFMNARRARASAAADRLPAEKLDGTDEEAEQQLVELVELALLHVDRDLSDVTAD